MITIDIIYTYRETFNLLEKEKPRNSFEGLTKSQTEIVINMIYLI
jgi:hypothetical protein